MIVAHAAHDDLRPASAEEGRRRRAEVAGYLERAVDPRRYDHGVFAFDPEAGMSFDLNDVAHGLVPDECGTLFCAAGWLAQGARSGDGPVPVRVAANVHALAAWLGFKTYTLSPFCDHLGYWGGDAHYRGVTLADVLGRLRDPDDTIHTEARHD